MKPRHDIYATVTDQLVAAIEAGAGNWRMPGLGHLASVFSHHDGVCAGRA
jgi:antirestriction protein ArdC